MKNNSSLTPWICLLAELRIDSIDLNASEGYLPDAGNIIANTAHYRQRASDEDVAEEHLLADVLFAVNFAQTDSNPNRALDEAPDLDSDIFELPWLRGYGNVKSLHVAYQESPALRQAAIDLIAEGRLAILNNFDGFLAKWTGLEAAHQAQGVKRRYLTTAAFLYLDAGNTHFNTDGIVAANDRRYAVRLERNVA